MARRLSLLAAAILLGLAAFFLLRRSSAPVSEKPVAAAPVATPKPAPLPLVPVAPAEPPLERSHLADQLNAPGGTIQQDLRILNDTFGAWQTNFPHEGNPVGENEEITAALTGKNRFRFAFIAPDHPAINARGQLCDRWGTPFFFHQTSGTQMEIRSSGPDKIKGTADDVVFKP